MNGDTIIFHHLQHLLYQHIFSDIHAQGIDLKHQIFIEFIDDQPGQTIGIGKDDAAAIGLNDRLAVFPGILEALIEK